MLIDNYIEKLALIINEIYSYLFNYCVLSFNLPSKKYHWSTQKKFMSVHSSKSTKKNWQRTKMLKFIETKNLPMHRYSSYEHKYIKLLYFKRDGPSSFFSNFCTQCHLFKFKLHMQTIGTTHVWIEYSIISLKMYPYNNKNLDLVLDMWCLDEVCRDK